MDDHISSSLIITTYNWPEALKLVLLSVCEQSVRPGEVIIADDGSETDTAKVIKDIMMDSGLAWRHVRHGDQGVRQSRIKNLAVKYSRAPYLIFVDHDVILHPEFIADHLSMAKNNVFLQGKRALLPDYYTEMILAEGSFIPPKYWMRGLGNRKNVFRFQAFGRLFSRLKNFEISLRGCNLSMYKRDFIKVDGFDEAFDQSWGREDSDICYRLFHSGLSIKTLWFSALQYHLKHKVVTNWHKERLDKELHQTLEEKRVKAKIGLSKLSSEGEIVAASYDFNITNQTMMER
ncbi:glycosyltransferase [Thermodesulfobacteriota bacterium]